MRSKPRLPSLVTFTATGLALSGAAACANYSQLQDAETLPTGKTSVGVGASFTKYEVENTDADGNKVTDSVSVPAIVISARRGLTDRAEVQATAWLPFGARIGGKYQLVGKAGQTGPQLSIGGHLGYLSISASAGDSEATARWFDAYLPLYAGYRLSPSFELYAVPQYIFRYVTGGGSNASGHVFGATAGVAIGEHSKFYLEAASFYDTLVESAVVNTALGISL